MTDTGAFVYEFPNARQVFETAHLAGATAVAWGRTNYTKTLPYPLGVSVEGDDGQVHLNWEKVAGATGYNIYRKQGNEAPIFAGSTINPYMSITDLTNDTIYNFAVSAINKFGEGPLGVWVKEAPYNTKPTPPSTPGWNSQKIEWSSVARAETYRVYAKPYSSGSYKLVATVTEPYYKYAWPTIYAIIGSDRYGMYDFKVSSVNRFGESSLSGWVRVVHY